jgi:hypothetical protein
MVRDLLVLDHLGELLVIATDAAGGVGPKPCDGVHAPAYVVGLFTARVALMEVMACGARPIAVALGVCCEPEPVAAQVREGVLEEMGVAGVDGGALVMSSEKNLLTVQTGVGVTVLGTVRPQGFRPGRARPGDRVLLAGRPKVGGSVEPRDPELADLPTVVRALASGHASDLLPVGSRGAAAEAHSLARSSGLTYVPEFPAGLDPLASAGPATALLISAAPGSVQDLIRTVSPKPCRDVGYLTLSGGSGRSRAGREPEAPTC